MDGSGRKEEGWWQCGQKWEEGWWRCGQKWEEGGMDGSGRLKIDLGRIYNQTAEVTAVKESNPYHSCKNRPILLGNVQN